MTIKYFFSLLREKRLDSDTGIYLKNIIGWIYLGIISLLLGLGYIYDDFSDKFIAILIVLLSIKSILGIRILYQRLHDLEMSGYNFLRYILISRIIGWVPIKYYILFKVGTLGENKYGGVNTNIIKIDLGAKTSYFILLFIDVCIHFYLYHLTTHRPSTHGPTDTTQFLLTLFILLIMNVFIIIYIYYKFTKKKLS